MSGVKDSVKSFVVGSTEEPHLSAQIKDNFIRHALKDTSTGELYMTENEFIDAIVPSHEDYVSCLGYMSFIHPQMQNRASAD